MDEKYTHTHILNPFDPYFNKSHIGESIEIETYVTTQEANYQIPMLYKMYTHTPSILGAIEFNRCDDFRDDNFHCCREKGKHRHL